MMPNLPESDIKFTFQSKLTKLHRVIESWLHEIVGF